jgi:hypothetical protein
MVVCAHQWDVGWGVRLLFIIIWRKKKHLESYEENSRKNLVQPRHTANVKKLSFLHNLLKKAK